MANAAVDKLKDFGLRHGEKVAMGVVAVIFVGCTYLAFSHETIDIEAEQIDKSARAASDNLNKPQNETTIKDRLTEEGIALANFEKKVVDRQAGAVDASRFAITRPIVRLEPGAGLVRDRPELIAPTDLIVHAGRGAVRIIALDESGLPKLKAEEKGASTQPAAKKSETLAEARARRDAEEAARKKALAIGGVSTKAEAEAETAPILGKAEDYEQVTRGYRYVTMIGKLDHKKMRELHAKAIKTDEADPHYLRLDVERQQQGSDGSWDEWAAIDRDAYLDVKNRLTEQDKELAPPAAIISSLVDPLPFLQVGYYVGAHHAALMPKAVLSPTPAAGAAGGPPGGGKGRGQGMLGGAGFGSGSDYAKAGLGGVASGGGYAAAMGGGMSMGMGEDNEMGGLSGGGPVGGPSQGDFEKSAEDWLMIRVLDFDVQPDSIYRYRARVVVANPNYGWENVNPGVDNTSKELEGPWSEVTESVDVPPDVATYALRKATTAIDPTGEKVQFQVVKWSEDDGLTVVKTFDEGPGQIIGEKKSAQIPDPKDPSRAKNQLYDFTSHQVLTDVLGGDRPASTIADLGANRFESPALALVVRNDGMLVIRDQTADASNGQMKEMADIYDEILKEIKNPKKKGQSSMMNGLYGGMGGGMGGMDGGMGGMGEQ